MTKTCACGARMIVRDVGTALAFMGCLNTECPQTILNAIPKVNDRRLDAATRAGLKGWPLALRRASGDGLD